MNWIANTSLINQPDPQDIPRYLTDEEITSIVNKLPVIRGADGETSSNARDGILKWLTNEIRNCKISPSGIPELEQQIISYHLRSLVNPGTPVGIHAAEATAAPITQITLKAFHVAGSSKTTSVGIEAMKELLSARERRKVENATIFFKDKSLSYVEVLRKRRTFVGSTIADFISDNVYDNITIDDPKDMEKFWWHDVFINLTGVKIPPVKRILRIKLKVNELYNHGVSTADIARILESEVPRSVIAVYSPTSEGIIDLYPDVNVIYETLRSSKVMSNLIAEQAYLKIIVEPELANIRVKGIPGIKNIYPIVAPVWQIVLDERLLPPSSIAFTLKGITEETIKRAWQLFYNHNRMKTMGIKPENLAALLEACDITIVGGNEDFMVVILDAENVRPGELVLRKIDADRLATSKKDEERREKGLRPFSDQEPSLIERTSNFVYADTDGTNLGKLLSHPEIDSTLTYSHNIHEIWRTLGIEAARSFFISEFTEIIANNDSYVTPRHISLISDFITGRGVPLGIKYSGISRQAEGVISLATFQRGKNVLRMGALHGRGEDVIGVSTSIAIDKRVTIGTGAFDIDINQEEMDILAAQVKKSEKQYGKDEIISGIDDLEREVLGLSDIDLDQLVPGDGLLPPINNIEVKAPSRMSFKDIMSRGGTIEPGGMQKGRVIESKRIPVVPRNLLEALSKIKPTPSDEPGGPRLSISTLTKLPTREEIEASQIIAPYVGSGIPNDLLILIDKMDNMLLSSEVCKIPLPLPEVEIPTLPDLPDLSLVEEEFHERREQEVRQIDPQEFLRHLI